MVRHDGDTDRLPAYRWLEYTCYTCAADELGLHEAARRLDEVPPLPCRRVEDSGPCRGFMTPRVAAQGPRVLPLKPPDQAPEA